LSVGLERALNNEENEMTTIEMAKKAFASRGAVDAWFKDAATNFELFAEMVRKDEREACAAICDDLHHTWRFGDGDDAISGPQQCAITMRERSNVN
jgi:hypothetical protein